MASGKSRIITGSKEIIKEAILGYLELRIANRRNREDSVRVEAVINFWVPKSDMWKLHYKRSFFISRRSDPSRCNGGEVSKLLESTKGTPTRYRAARASRHLRSPEQSSRGAALSSGSSRTCRRRKSPTRKASDSLPRDPRESRTRPCPGRALSPAASNHGKPLA